VPGLASPYSFGSLLPAIYQEDDFAMRWMSAFDDVLAPCVLTIDNIEHYFDPALAPGDFVEMLAGWVGVELDETWSEESRRALVAEAVSLYRVRGTVAGLKRHVAIYTGVEPEIEESGGCTVSELSGGALPGSDRPYLVVRVRVDDPGTVDERRLSRLVASSKPAHLPHRVEVLATGAGPLPDETVLAPDLAPAPPASPPAGEEIIAGPLAARQPAEPGDEPLVVELSGVSVPPQPDEAAQPGASLLPPDEGEGPDPEEPAP
jgi:phage tail-like protein